jgi:hypothetical protein
MNRTKAIVGLTMTLISSAAFSNSAYAVDDSKFINGGACYSTFTTDTAGKVPRLNRFSGLINLANSQVQVSCPVVRDRLLGSGTITSGSAASVTMRLDGSKAGGSNISCTFQSLDGFGNLVDTDTKSGGAGGPTNLVLRVNKSSSSGFYAIQCNLPPLGRIIGYRLVEPTPTDNDSI